MQAIEFETRIGEGGNIRLPEEFRYAYGKQARLVVLLPNTREEPSTTTVPMKPGGANDFDRLLDATKNCWHGEDGLAYQLRLRSEWEQTLDNPS